MDTFRFTSGQEGSLIRAPLDQSVIAHFSTLDTGTAWPGLKGELGYNFAEYRHRAKSFSEFGSFLDQMKPVSKDRGKHLVLDLSMHGGQESPFTTHRYHDEKGRTIYEDEFATLNYFLGVAKSKGFGPKDITLAVEACTSVQVAENFRKRADVPDDYTLESQTENTSVKSKMIMSNKWQSMKAFNFDYSGSISALSDYVAYGRAGVNASDTIYQYVFDIKNISSTPGGRVVNINDPNNVMARLHRAGKLKDEDVHDMVFLAAHDNSLARRISNLEKLKTMIAEGKLPAHLRERESFATSKPDWIQTAIGVSEVGAAGYFLTRNTASTVNLTNAIKSPKAIIAGLAIGAFAGGVALGMKLMGPNTSVVAGSTHWQASTIGNPVDNFQEWANKRYEAQLAGKSIKGVNLAYFGGGKAAQIEAEEAAFRASTYGMVVTNPYTWLGLGAIGVGGAYLFSKRSKEVKSKIPNINLLQTGNQVSTEVKLANIIDSFTPSGSLGTPQPIVRSGAYNYRTPVSQAVAQATSDISPTVFRGPNSVKGGSGSTKLVSFGAPQPFRLPWAGVDPLYLGGPTGFEIQPYGIDIFDIGTYQQVPDPFSIETPRLSSPGPMPHGIDTGIGHYGPVGGFASRTNALGAPLHTPVRGIGPLPFGIDTSIDNYSLAPEPVDPFNKGTLKFGPVGVVSGGYSHPSTVKRGHINLIHDYTYGPYELAPSQITNQHVLETRTPVARTVAEATSNIKPTVFKAPGPVRLNPSLVLGALGAVAAVGLAGTISSMVTGPGGPNVPYRPINSGRGEQPSTPPRIIAPPGANTTGFIEGSVGYEGDFTQDILNRINSSKRGDTVDVAMYAINDQKLISALTGAKARGVDINMLVSKFTDGAETQRLQLETQGLSPYMLGTKHVAGGATQYMHDKVFAFIPASGDSTVIGYTGNAELSYYNNPSMLNRALNWGRSILGMPISTGTSDSGYRVQNNSFAAAIDALVKRPGKPLASNTGKGWMALTPNSPGNQTALSQIIGMINGAKTSIDITSMQLSDGDILTALLAAKGRGVDIKATIAGNTLENKVVDKLSKSGIEVRELPEWEGYYLHNKVLAVDNSLAYVGSSAMADRTFKHNYETGVFLKGSGAREATNIARADWNHGVRRELEYGNRWDTFILDDFMPKNAADADRIKYLVNPQLMSAVRDLAIQQGTINQLEAAPHFGTYLFSSLWSNGPMGRGSTANIPGIPTVVSEYDRLVAARTWGQTWMNLGSVGGLDFNFQQLGNRGPLDSFLIRLARSVDRINYGPDSGRINPYTGESSEQRPLEQLTRGSWDLFQNTILNVGSYYYWTLPVLRAQVATRSAILHGASVGPFSFKGIESMGAGYEAGKSFIGQPKAATAWFARYVIGRNWDRFWNRTAGEFAKTLLHPIAKITDPFLRAADTVENISNMYLRGGYDVTDSAGRVTGTASRTYAQSTRETYEMTDKWMRNHPFLRPLSSAGIGRFFLEYNPGYIWDQGRNLYEIYQAKQDLFRDLSASQKHIVNRVLTQKALGSLSSRLGPTQEAGAALQELEYKLWHTYPEGSYTAIQGQQLMVGGEAVPPNSTLTSRRAWVKIKRFNEAIGALERTAGNAANNIMGFNAAEGYGVRHGSGRLTNKLIAIGVPALILNRWAGELGAATRADVIAQSRFADLINSMPRGSRRDLDMAYTPGLPEWATPMGTRWKNESNGWKMLASAADTLPLIAGSMWYNVQKLYSSYKAFTRFKDASRVSVANSGVIGQSSLMNTSRRLAEAELFKAQYLAQSGDLRTANYLFGRAVSGPGANVSEYNSKEVSALGIQITAFPQIMTPTVGMVRMGQNVMFSMSLQGPVALQAGITLASPVGLVPAENRDTADLAGYESLFGLIGMKDLAGYSFGYIKGSSGESLFRLGVDVAGMSALAGGAGYAMSKTRLGDMFRLSYAYEATAPARSLMSIGPRLIPGTISAMSNLKEYWVDQHRLKDLGINHEMLGDHSYRIRDSILEHSDRTKRLEAALRALEEIDTNTDLKSRATRATSKNTYTAVGELINLKPGAITLGDAEKLFSGVLRSQSAGTALNAKWSKLSKAGLVAAGSILLTDMALSGVGMFDQQAAATGYKNVQEFFTGNPDNSQMGVANFVPHYIRQDNYSRAVTAGVAGAGVGYKLGRGAGAYGGRVGLGLGLAMGLLAYKPVSSLISASWQTGFGMIGSLFDTGYKVWRPAGILEEQGFEETAGDRTKMGTKPAEEIGFFQRHIDRWTSAGKSLYGGAQALFTGFNYFGFMNDLIDDDTFAFQKSAVYIDTGVFQFVAASGLAGTKKSMERDSMMANWVVNAMVSPNGSKKVSSRTRKAAVGQLWHSQSPTYQASYAVGIQMRQRMEQTNWILSTDSADVAQWYYGRSTGKLSDNVWPGLMSELKKWSANGAGAGISKVSFFAKSNQTKKFYEYFEQVINSSEDGSLPELTDFAHDWSLESNSFGQDGLVGFNPRDFYTHAMQSDFRVKTAYAVGITGGLIAGAGAAYTFFRGKPAGYVRQTDYVSEILNGESRAPKMGYTGLNPVWDDAGRAVNGFGNKISERGAFIIGENLYTFGDHKVEYGNPLRGPTGKFVGEVNFRAFKNTMLSAKTLRGGAGLKSIQMGLHELAEHGASMDLSSPHGITITQNLDKSLHNVSREIKKLSLALDAQAKMLTMAADGLDNLANKPAGTIGKINARRSAAENTKGLKIELLESFRYVEGLGNINPYKEIQSLEKQILEAIKLEQLRLGGGANVMGQLNSLQRNQVAIKFLNTTSSKFADKTNAQVLETLVKTTSSELANSLSEARLVDMWGFKHLPNQRIFEIFGHKVMVNSAWQGLSEAIRVSQESWFGWRGEWEKANQAVRTKGQSLLTAELNNAFARTHSGIMGEASDDLLTAFHNYQTSRAEKNMAITAEELTSEYGRLAQQMMSGAEAADPELYKKLSDAERLKIERYSHMLSGKDKLGIATRFGMQVTGKALTVPFKIALHTLPPAMFVSGFLRDTDFMYSGSIAANTSEPLLKRREAAKGMMTDWTRAPIVPLTMAAAGFGIHYAVGAQSAMAAVEGGGWAARSGRYLKGMLNVKAGMEAVRASFQGAKLMRTGGLALGTFATIGAGGAALPVMAGLGITLGAFWGVEALWTGDFTVGGLGFKFNSASYYLGKLTEDSAKDPDATINWLDNTVAGNFTGMAMTAGSIMGRIWQTGVDLTVGAATRWADDSNIHPVWNGIGKAAQFLYPMVSSMRTDSTAGWLFRPEIGGSSPSLKSSTLMRSPLWYGTVKDFIDVQTRQQEKAMLGDPGILLSMWIHESSWGRESEQVNFSTPPRRADVWSMIQGTSPIGEATNLILKQRALETQPLLFSLNDRSKAFGGSNREGTLGDSGYHSEGLFLTQDAITYRGQAWGGDFVNGQVISGSQNISSGATKGAYDRQYGRYDSLVQMAASRYKLDPNIIRAIMLTEGSHGDPTAGSSAGARGLMQIMPDTYYGATDKKGRFHPGLKQNLGLSGDITDPESNIMAGAGYLSYLIRRYKGDKSKAFAAYNAGEGAVDSGRAAGYSETVKYVPKALGFFNDLTSPSGSTGGGSVEQFIRHATTYIGKPYLLGGGHGGFTTGSVDCSGLVSQAGISIGRSDLSSTADIQGRMGKAVAPTVQSLRRGDLVFRWAHDLQKYKFQNNAQGWSVDKQGNMFAGHVGIYLGNGLVLESGGRTKSMYGYSQTNITPLSKGYWHFARRVFSENDTAIIDKIVIPVKPAKPVNRLPFKDKKKTVVISAVREKPKTQIDNASRSRIPNPTVACMDKNKNLNLGWLDGDQYSTLTDNQTRPNRSYDDFFRV